MQVAEEFVGGNLTTFKNMTESAFKTVTRFCSNERLLKSFKEKVLRLKPACTSGTTNPNYNVGTSRLFRLLFFKNLRL